MKVKKYFRRTPTKFTTVPGDVQSFILKLASIFLFMSTRVLITVGTIFHAAALKHFVMFFGIQTQKK